MIIAIEGIDQAGKSTQTAMLQDALERAGIESKTFSFPDYATTTGRRIREHLAAGGGRLDPRQLHKLMADNRREKLDQIQSAMQRGQIIIMNRYYQSNMAYGLANGMDPGWLEEIDRDLPKTDLVILLDIGPGESAARKRSGRDKFERDGELLGKIASAYKTIAGEESWDVVDASKTVQEVHNSILGILRKRGIGP